ncbi:hypothetical protein [Pectinatus frisingensis]|uniref:hypothetical protein n=1 Tax=Pectinatus frisingensis TaxID=865 RepID=UPI001E346AE8|nr:hypothetical protein [Pectinatus frisingensis]
MDVKSADPKNKTRKRMISMFTKQLKTIVLVAFLFFSIVAFINPNTTYAADASQVGVVNYQQLINQHPDMAQANETYKVAVKQAQDDFNAKSANMNDQDKKPYPNSYNKESNKNNRN